MTWWLIPLGLVALAVLFVAVGIIVDGLESRRLERLQAEQQADMEPNVISVPSGAGIDWESWRAAFGRTEQGEWIVQDEWRP